jgi:hypothetical protein
MSNKNDTIMPVTCVGALFGYVNFVQIINATTDAFINSTSLYYINSGGFIGTVANSANSVASTIINSYYNGTIVAKFINIG